MNEGVQLRVDGSLAYHEKLLTYDGIHPNDRGNLVLADLIAQGVYEALQRGK